MRVIYFILIAFFIAGCTQKNKIPRGILSQEKMRFIMWDMIRADEYANNFLVKNASLDINSEKASLYEQIFKLHSTKADIFKKSLAFYQSKPNLLKVIIDSLRSEERRVLQEQYKPSPIITDSLVPVKPGSKPTEVN